MAWRSPLDSRFGDVSWIYSGDGTCTGTGNGDIDMLVNLPPAGLVRFLLTATVAKSPETPISNTATATAPDGTVGTATDGPDAVGMSRWI